MCVRLFVWATTIATIQYYYEAKKYNIYNSVYKLNVRIQITGILHILIYYILYNGIL